MKSKWYALIVFIVALPFAYLNQDKSSTIQYSDEAPPSSASEIPKRPTVTQVNDQAIRQAVQNRQSNTMVQSSGRVSRILADDNEGSRHQKFIIKLSSGQTVLFAHNIDLAPRVSGIKAGDVIEFYGEYEWNEKGGVIHWTHHDPANRHPHGWIKHNGSTYQ